MGRITTARKQCADFITGFEVMNTLSHPGNSPADFEAQDVRRPGRWRIHTGFLHQIRTVDGGPRNINSHMIFGHLGRRFIRFPAQCVATDFDGSHHLRLLRVLGQAQDTVCWPRVALITL